jgi:hypothetical protein
MLTSCYPGESPLKFVLPSKKYAHFFISLLFGLTFSFPANAQLRQVYLDTQANNQVMKISFFSPSTGYIGFYNWVGFTLAQLIRQLAIPYNRKYRRQTSHGRGYQQLDLSYVDGGRSEQGILYCRAAKAKRGKNVFEIPEAIKSRLTLPSKGSTLS